MRNGDVVQQFEAAFSEYVKAEYAIALCNGTATLHTALVALGVKPGDRVAVPPLTMSATTIAILHAGAVPVFVDVDPDTWLMKEAPHPVGAAMSVSLYGLHADDPGGKWVDDAAQTLRPYHKDAGFVSYSFQASKILALGEGGMLVTDHPGLARKAREFSSLGYSMDPKTPRIDPATLKHPSYARHHSLGWNYRMSHLVSNQGLVLFSPELEDAAPWFTPDGALAERRESADYYREAIAGCSWITPQHVPDGWIHDYWCYAVALESAELWEPFTESIVRHGGEMPYGAWRLTYQEPAFQHLVDWEHDTFDGHTIPRPICPVAEDLQPRLVQFQTNNVQSAIQNADAVAKAIREIGG